MHVHLHVFQLSPENSEDFIEYLKSIGRLDDAAVKLAEIVNRVGNNCIEQRLAIRVKVLLLLLFNFVMV